MAFAAYYRSRIESGTLTASDCTDLIFQSTVTHTQDAHGAWNALPHPPHAHAHMSNDGFKRALSGEQATRLRQLKPNASRLNKAKAEYEKLRHIARGTDDQEGRHLDPATRGEMDPERQLVDPNTRYIDRAQPNFDAHSQFEDGEAAAMALFYALVSPAGGAALAYLNQANRRAVLKSCSAALGLNGPAIAYNNPPAKHSAHPLRNQTPRVIERGPGGANTQTTAPRAPIGGVVTILDFKPGDMLVLATHYPVQAIDWTANKDLLERKTVPWSPGATQVEFDQVAVRPQLRWNTPDTARGFFCSRYKGLVCVKCGTVHTGSPGFRYGEYWYKCKSCGVPYCGGCKSTLQVRTAGYVWNEYTCKNGTCAGVVAAV